ncbi:hypothetical protein Ciccas_002168 [Cichlidogyrus casuarinus]|uniref:Uncharacterized protein n=1 Tax=Cichlidogyrus casuarinus TaxID=1844966 RepID=A0ABD2QHZ4_9PLAT
MHDNFSHCSKFTLFSVAQSRRGDHMLSSWRSNIGGEVSPITDTSSVTLDLPPESPRPRSSSHESFPSGTSYSPGTSTRSSGAYDLETDLASYVNSLAGAEYDDEATDDRCSFPNRAYHCSRFSDSSLSSHASDSDYEHLVKTRRSIRLLWTQRRLTK